MILRIPVAVGSLVVLALSLGLAGAPLSSPQRWIGEVEGDSMTPTLVGQRAIFPCQHCGEVNCFSQETIELNSLLQCSSCQEWQTVPQDARQIAADRVVVEPAAPGRSFRTGEIVAIEHPQFGRIIKRIAAGPGDTVRVTSQLLWVNEIPFQPPPVDPRLRAPFIGAPASQFIPSPLHHLAASIPPWSVTLEGNQYFVVGDCLEASDDSRNRGFGMISRSQILGVATKIAVPSASRFASTAKAK
jgi:signal peptidase I